MSLAASFENPIQPPTFCAGMSDREIYFATTGLRPEERMRFWSTFQSTPEVPFPAAATGNSIDDIAAVLAGSKPATLFAVEKLADPEIGTLISGAENLMGSFTQAEVVNVHGDPIYLLGREENVRTLARLYQGRGGQSTPLPTSEDFHRAVGHALGYPTDAINAYVKHISKA